MEIPHPVRPALIPNPVGGQWRCQILAAVMDALPRGADVLTLGWPDASGLEELADPARGLRLRGVATEAMLTSHPELARSVDPRDAIPLVGKRAAQVTIHRGRPFCGVQVNGHIHHLTMIGLADLLERLNSPSLIYLAALPGHGDLLDDVRDIAERDGIISWIDLPATDGGAELADLSTSILRPSVEAFSIDLDGRVRCVSARDGLDPHRAATAIVLFPRHKWDAVGLRQAAEDFSWPPSTAAMLRRSRHDGNHETLRVPRLHRVLPTPASVRRKAGQGFWVADMAARPGVAHAPAVFSAEAHDTLNCILPMPPIGTIRLGFCLNASPTAECRIELGNRILQLHWHPETEHLSCATPIEIADDRSPLMIRMRAAVPGTPMGLELTGIEMTRVAR